MNVFHINKQLKQLGIGSVYDPHLMVSLAFLVKDHEHFRQVLMAVPPDKRTLCYDSLRPHLRFEPKSLFDYEADARTAASEKELKHVLELRDPLETIAEQALARQRVNEHQTNALVLICKGCTVEMAFPGDTRREAIRAAVIAGWTRSGGSIKNGILCPSCSKNKHA